MLVFNNYVLNGQGHGDIGEQLQTVQFDSGYLRPYFNNNGVPCVTINTGKRYDAKKKKVVPKYEQIPIRELYNAGMMSPVLNATTMRKEEWILFDQMVVEAARERLVAWGDLARKSTYSGFDGMSKLVLEHETQSDPGSASVDMDALSDSTGDQPLYQLEGLPLPITHSDFAFSQRRLMVSRNTGTPLDNTMIANAGRRVAEAVEKTLIGVQTGLTFGGSNTLTYGRTSQVYGYTNFPARQTYTSVTTPTGTNPASTLADVLAMRDLLYDANMFGPYMLYHSTDWDQYMDNDYYVTSTGAPYVTLRQRLRTIEGITDVKRLDFMTPAALGSTFNLLLVQMTPDVARAVIGMNLSTVQWESKGGLQLNFKVMAIHVPQLRADYSDNCGICHGTPS